MDGKRTPDRYPSFELYPTTPHPQSTASVAANGIAAVGGALGAMIHVTTSLITGPRHPSPAANPPTPASGPAMPSSPAEGRRWEAKVDQLIHRFFIKTALVVIDARLEPLTPDHSPTLAASTHSATTSSAERPLKRDKWVSTPSRAAV